jgi:hypothetical protein
MSDPKEPTLDDVSRVQRDAVRAAGMEPILNYPETFRLPCATCDATGKGRHGRCPCCHGTGQTAPVALTDAMKDAARKAFGVGMKAARKGEAREPLIEALIAALRAGEAT